MDLNTKLADGSYPLQIGNIRLDASILNDRNFSDLMNYVRSKYIAMAYEAGKLLKPEEARELRADAMKLAADFEWTSDETQSIIWKPEGVIQLGFRSIQKRHPRISYEEFYKMCTEIGDTDKEKVKNYGIVLENIAQVYQILNYPSKEDLQLMGTDNLGASGGAPAANTKSE